MPLTISIELLTGTYEAGDADDKGRPEWPPHPARLFCALVSSARTEAERDALTWLEGQEPPLIVAAARHNSSQFSSYVVTNERVIQGKSQTHPARVNQLRVRARALPSSPVVSFVWPDVAADVEMVGRIDAICRRVPYLGRSTGIALVHGAAVSAVPEVASGDAEASAQVFEPCDDLDDALMLRVPYPGYLAELDELFESGRPSWQANRYLYYRVRTTMAASQATVDEPSVYRDVVVLRFVNLRPEGRLVARFTEQLRSMVLKSAGPDAPGVLHGHGADGRPHVAFLGLPNVSTGAGADQHGTGHLLGLALAVPDLPEAERKAVLGAVLGLRRRSEGGDLDTIALGVRDIGEVHLKYAPGLVRPWGATPERWRRGSDRWATATPVLLDRYPRRGESAEDVIRASVRQVGLPEPVDVEVETDPFVKGAVRLRPADLPKKFAGRLFRHVRLTFDRPVAGPVMLGAGRYQGIGLLAPVTARDRPEPGVLGSSRRMGVQA